MGVMGWSIRIMEPIRPCRGNHPRLPCSVICRIMPSQKIGMATPEMEKARLPWSMGLSLRTAEITPKGMPMIRAINMDTETSSKVAPYLRPTSSSTGCLVLIETPRSPFSKLPI